MNVKITKAKAGDFAYIQEKINRYLLDSSNLDWRNFFVARVEDKVVAFGRIIDHGEFHEIASLGVDYYHRKKGIGKKMLFFLIQKAKRIDARKPIYGVTHLPEFISSCGFVHAEDGYPDYLDYKRKHACRLDESKISIMEWKGILG